MALFASKNDQAPQISYLHKGFPQVRDMKEKMHTLKREQRRGKCPDHSKQPQSKQIRALHLTVLHLLEEKNPHTGVRQNIRAIETLLSWESAEHTAQHRAKRHQKPSWGLGVIIFRGWRRSSEEKLEFPRSSVLPALSALLPEPPALAFPAG